jgi:hypothetical protein
LVRSQRRGDALCDGSRIDGLRDLFEMRARVAGWRRARRVLREQAFQIVE